MTFMRFPTKSFWIEIRLFAAPSVDAADAIDFNDVSTLEIMSSISASSTLAAVMSKFETETVTAPAPVVVKVLSRIPDWSAASNNSVFVMSISRVFTETDPLEERSNEDTMDLLAW